MAQPNTHIFTIGHSNRTVDDFLALLHESDVQCVVDVRRLPGSDTFPHFNADALKASLAAVDIDYWRLPALCGRRSAGEVRNLPVEPFWRNASFARYAAWAHSNAFAQALRALRKHARTQRCVLMCSEAVWWRCHRRIIADHLLADGCDVSHIMDAGKVVSAKLTQGACIREGRVVYSTADET